MDVLEVLVLAYTVLAAFGFVVGAVLGGPTRNGRGAWAMVGLLLPPALVLLLLRRYRGEPAVPGSISVAVAHAPVRVPSEEEMADVRMPVEACPNCAFLGIRTPGAQDGVWLGGGELVEQVCPRCGYRGAPMVFDRPEDYRAFVRDLWARG